MQPNQQQPPITPTAPPDQPVAYDVHGQPLYSHPQQQPSSQQQPVFPDAQRSSHVTAQPDHIPGQNYDPRIRAQYANEPMVRHASRDVNLQPFEVSEDVQSRTDESRRNYPHLNISDGEFVILDIKRHPIGLMAPLFAGGVVLLAIVVGLIMYPADTTNMGIPSFEMALLVAILIMALVGIGTFIAIWVYLQNQFFLTNESVIQEIQTSLFARREQMVSLGSIEDASYKQIGILQTMLNYGTIRLSTEGDETTYRFAFVSDPRTQVQIVNNAIEAFKNGRPYNSNDDMN